LPNRAALEQNPASPPKGSDAGDERQLFFHFSRPMKILLQRPKPLAFACVLAVCAVAVSGRPDDAPTRTTSGQAAQVVEYVHPPLEALDREIQKRFHNVIGFGMARIATERRFEPETKAEREAVRMLGRAGYKVGLYLVGRGVLEPMPARLRRAKTAFGSDRTTGEPFSGPIFLSSPTITSVPSAAALWDETQNAMRAFEKGSNRYGFVAGKWQVEARPVRASEESCLRCHKTDYKYIYSVNDRGEPFYNVEPKGNVLKVGDTLGVLLYLYKEPR